MAGFKESFGGNVDFAYGQRAVLGRQMDIAGGIERGLSSVGGFTREMGKASAALRDLKKELGDLDKQHTAAVFAGDAKEVARLEKEMKRASKTAKELREQLSGMPLDALEKGLGNLTKGLLKFNTSLLGLGLDFVIDSLKRVYELQERWAKAIGGFNLQLGGMTKGLGGATKAAVQWSSTLRGLTDTDIAEGIQMFGEFAMALGQVQKAMDFGKWGIEVARGFNLGGAGAAKLASTLDSMGDSAQDMTKFMGADMVKSANAAGVPINLLAKDISESTGYMARFGKEGQKTFVQGAAFAHKFYMSIKDVQRSVEGLDMFDEAARTASKLNTVFGTMTNSMDLMMEDDPVKRIEMIRQQFLALGKTEDRLSPKEIRYLSETMHLTEEQTRALLSRKNAGISYADFQKKAAATEKEEADAKRNMELMLRKTAQTLFAFGAAFDRVTVAIANAIRPMLKVFGLAHDGGKEFKSFGQVMSGITDTVVEFFNSLAKDPRWNDFMETLAKDMISAGHALKEFVLSGNAAKMVGDLASAMKDFYVWVRDLAKSAVPLLEPLGRAFLFLAKNVDRIATAWLALKATGGIKSFLGNMGAMQGGGMASLFGKGGAGSKALGGMGVGMAAGGLLGGGGAMVGGALGGLAGPLGGAIGAVVGKAIEKLWTRFDSKSYNEQRDLQLGAIGKNADRQKRAAADMDMLSVKGRQTALRRQQADELVLQLQKNRRPIETHEIEMLRERAQELQGFGKHTKLAARALLDLKPGAELSTEELGALQEASAALAKKTSELSGVEDQLLQQDLKKSGLEADKLALEASQAAGKSLESQLSASQKTGDDLHKMQDELKEFNVLGIHSAKWNELQARIVQERAKQEKLNDGILNQQLVTSNKQRDIEEKQLVLAQKDALRKELVESGKFTGKPEELQDFMRRYAATNENEIRNKLGIQAGDEGNAQYSRLIQSFAGGGIVRGPTRALIGESGPEAVVPLRAMVRGKLRNPDRFGGEAARNLVGGAPEREKVITVATDVVLDGQKVGRALVRTHITGRN